MALGTVFPLFPSHPFSVWSSAYDTAVLSIPLQQWRSLGKYYIVHRQKAFLVNPILEELPDNEHVAA